MASISRRTFLAAAAAAPMVATARQGRTRGRKYKGCIIGDTHRGGYGHDLHQMWNLHDDIETVALADPDPEGRARRAKECGAQRTYADYREMLEKEQPDLVSIAPRWTIHHQEHLLACAAHGAHGIIEKPVAPDLAACDRMVNAVDNARLKWCVAFNYRVSPLAAHARKLIVEEGLIGDVLEIRGRGKEDHRAGGEDLIVLGIHNFDLMTWFFGPPDWVQADITMDGRPARPGDVREATEPLGPVVGDRLQATYGYPNGVKGYYACMKNTHGDGGRWGLEIYGSRGIVTMRMEPVPPIHLLPDPSWAPGMSGAKWEPLPGAPKVDFGGNLMLRYKPLIDDLVAAIEEDRQPMCNLHDGRMAHEMIQGVWQSHIQDGARVAVPMTVREHPLKHWKEA